ncbi:hypothetical protein JK358_14860 [Nocardia sp. 2]|uniref:Phthiocerol/phthiodiolone dimycocerosyl transferase n=1 Tax=Nocardia acididurans TaxID=2802282 RepID=A0ABS1M558_9NOCA|nr:hypothetical protein [Nocardia acididurans]MBL1075674.1 hypothetical protein [Nocardia acididurans]
MKYRVGLIDQGFVPTAVTVSYVAICTGAVDDELLRRAFALTCRRFPMLRGRIEFDGGAYQLDIPEDDGGNAVTEILHGSVSDWFADGAAALDPAVSLAKLEIVRGSLTTAVALRISHAVNDAHMGFELLREFWRRAAELGANATVLDPVPVFPRTLEELLIERGVALQEPVMPDLTGVYALTPAETHGRPGLRLAADERITVSATDTTALLQHARAQGTTLHALLSAAIIRAERTLLAETSSAAPADELPMIAAHAVDMRPHLCPPAQPAEVTNGLGCAATVTFCTPHTDLHALGKEVKAQIVGGIDSGAALTTMFAASVIPEHGTRDFVANIITNWGVVPELDVPKGMRMVDFRGFVTGSARAEISYFAYTFQGRLNVEFTFDESCHRPERVRELRRVVASNLKLLTDRAI